MYQKKCHHLVCYLGKDACTLLMDWNNQGPYKQVDCSSLWEAAKKTPALDQITGFMTMGLLTNGQLFAEALVLLVLCLHVEL